MYFGVQSFSFGYPRPKLKLWTPISPIIHVQYLYTITFGFLMQINDKIEVKCLG